MSQEVISETLKKYQIEFCSKVLEKAYDDRSTLSGPDLLKLTPVRQVNQDIVSRLSVYWNSQLHHFQSAYFDFSHPAVKEALRQFSGVVSQHISLRREDLEPWLQEAVRKALAPFEAGEAASPESELRLRQFSEVLPLRLPDAEKPEPVREEAPLSFFDWADEPAPAPKPGTPVTEAVTPVLKTEEKPTEPQSINSRHKVEIPATPEELLYGSVHVRIDNIGRNIPLGQRFMFVGQLFNGDFEAFSRAVEALDKAEGWDHAYGVLTGELAPQYGWDLKSEAVKELVTLLRRRFT